MISIIGNSVDELANLQSIIETGLLNNDESTTLDVTYKLSSRDILLVDQYNHIVGRKEQKNDR